MKNIHAFTKKSATVPHKLAFSVLRKQHFQGQVSNHGYSPLPFHVSEPAKRRRCLGWNQWENLARFQGNVFPGGKSLPGSGGTFSRVGKACSDSEERFPRREKLARFRGNIFPSGKTLPGSRGTFSQAEKPCRAAQEHFPGRGKLAALRGNTFPSRKTLPRCAGTFSQAGKPCRTPRQGFNDNLLAAIISRSLTSGRMRYAPTVSGEIQNLNDTIHHNIPNK